MQFTTNSTRLVFGAANLSRLPTSPQATQRWLAIISLRRTSIHTYIYYNICGSTCFLAFWPPNAFALFSAIAPSARGTHRYSFGAADISILLSGAKAKNWHCSTLSLCMYACGKATKMQSSSHAFCCMPTHLRVYIFTYIYNICAFVLFACIGERANKVLFIVVGRACAQRKHLSCGGTPSFTLRFNSAFIDF